LWWGRDVDAGEHDHGARWFPRAGESGGEGGGSASFDGEPRDCPEVVLSLLDRVVGHEQGVGVAAVGRRDRSTSNSEIIARALNNSFPNGSVGSCTDPPMLSFTSFRATAPRPAGCRRCRVGCRSCSATAPPRIRRTGSSPCTRGCATSSSSAAWRRRRSGSSTTTRNRGRRRNCSTTAAPVGCRCWWGPRRRWAPAPTSRTGRWRCTTWTCRGARRTWSNERAASCARATRTREWRS